MNDEACDNDADLWLNLLSRLQQGQKDAQRLPIRWSYPIDLIIGKEQARDRWFYDDIAHREPVLRILARWLERGIVDDSSEELRWLFAVRFDPAIDLVARLIYSKGNLTPDAIWTTFFPFPRLPANEVLKLLLGEWWNYAGSHLFFDDYYDSALRSRETEQ